MCIKHVTATRGPHYIWGWCGLILNIARGSGTPSDRPVFSKTQPAWPWTPPGWFSWTELFCSFFTKVKSVWCVCRHWARKCLTLRAAWLYINRLVEWARVPLTSSHLFLDRYPNQLEKETVKAVIFLSGSCCPSLLILCSCYLQKSWI